MLGGKHALARRAVRAVDADGEVTRSGGAMVDEDRGVRIGCPSIGHCKDIARVGRIGSGQLDVDETARREPGRRGGDREAIARRQAIGSDIDGIGVAPLL